MSKEDEEVVEDRGDLVEPIEDEELDEEEVEELDDEDEDEEDEEVGDDEEEEDEDEVASDEDEEDDEEDDEDGEDEDDQEEDEAGEDTQRIPKSRLDQVIKQREEERERSAWLQEQLEAMIQRQTVQEEEAEEEEPVAPEYDFDTAESKYIELILEGESDKATALRREISDARSAEYQFQIESVRKAATNDAVDRTTNSLDEQRFQTLLSGYVSEYDFLNDESDSYNAKAVTMANKLMASYLAEGELKSEALKKAVDDITPLYAPAKKSAKATVDKGAVRKKAARRKAAKASRSQPPRSKGKTGKVKRSLDSVDVEKMSDRDWDTLTNREKAKLRGDIV